MRSSFAAVGDVLRRLAPRLGLETKLLELTLKQEWESVVGSQIAAHARPGRIRFKKLQVLAASSAWVQQLTFLKPMLIQRINETAGGAVITDLVVGIGDLAEAESSPSPHDRGKGRDRAAAPSAAQMEEAAAHARSIHDDELRAQITNVMASLLSLSDRPRPHPPAPRKHPTRDAPPEGDRSFP